MQEDKPEPEFGFTPVRTAAFDFDNTLCPARSCMPACVLWLSTIPKFKGKEVLGPPIEGAREFIQTLRTHGWKIIIFSTRSAKEIKPWLEEHQIPYDEINQNSDLQGTNPGKPVYDILIDDRCIQFQGTYDNNLLSQVLNFKPYYERNRTPEPEPPTFPVICLCGSTKFKDDFERIKRKLTLQGNLVLSVVFYIHDTQDPAFAIVTKKKEMLDQIHLQKIRMSDRIYVINRGRYIGESTKNEIEYAKSLGKPIQYMEEPP